MHNDKIKVTPALRELIGGPQKEAAEHLALEILDWGTTPTRRQFPLPGGILIGWVSRIISTHPAIETVIAMMNLQVLRPNPFDDALKLEPSVRYRVAFHAGPPLLKANGRTVLYVQRGSWEGISETVMLELGDAFLGGHIDPAQRPS